MIIINFTHPLTDEQRATIEQLAGEQIEHIYMQPIQIDQTKPLVAQVAAIVEAVGLSSEDWQTRSLLINPPGYAPAAQILLAELHGRMGHFPTLVRLRPRQGPVATYEVAELINLQTVREEARQRR